MAAQLNDAPPALLEELTVPSHPLLMAYTSRTEDWLDYETGDGFPADFCLEWTEDVTTETGHAQRHIEHGPDTETDHVPMYTFGRFAELSTAVSKVIERPTRNADAPIELEISEWSLHYLRAA